ncbi:MAG: carboxymethylenebutenolidase [Chthoniobacter sp.]|jgi:carboxymethylenebutenolidase|nr:carboxymethylenebutenolidase [Chthoniobacter sp.]
MMTRNALAGMATILATIAFFTAPPLMAQEWAKEKLEKSSRHGEWVEVKNGEGTVRCFLVFPEAKTKAAAVVVVHENFGLTDWVRGVADQLAEAGYIAIAPDMLSGQTFTGVDDARKAISQLPEPQVLADLDAVTAHVSKLPACNGKVAIAGFCWGGGTVFKFANHNRELKAAYVFYGTGPTDTAGAANIQCPVYGFYAENDARVTSTVPKSGEEMKAAGKIFDPQTYAGAGHGFMRAGEAPDASEADRKAHEDAWSRWKSLLGKL